MVLAANAARWSIVCRGREPWEVPPGGGDEAGVEREGAVGADEKGVDFEALVGGSHLAVAGEQPES